MVTPEAGPGKGTEYRPAGSDAPGDDYVLSFTTDKSRALGRVIRLGALADGILTKHDYPKPVGELLGQALALAGMLGSTLKFSGNLILQTQTDGPLGLVVANFEAPGKLRGYASFDAARCQAINGEPVDQAKLLGDGHLALTIDPGGYMDRYQGIVALVGSTLSDAANSYFRQSEQLPTFVRLAIARHHSGAGGDGGWHWRAGGLMVQYVSPVGGRALEDGRDEDAGGNRAWLIGEHEEDWQRVCALAATVEDHELLDPTLSSERLLYRLFHEEGVRAVATEKLAAFCRCSRARVETFLSTFKGDDIAEMLDSEGKIAITCEFCNEVYRFDRP